MIDLTAPERAIILSRSKQNPGGAFMQAVDILRDRMNDAIEKIIADKPNTETLKAALRTEVVADLTKEIANLETVLLRLEENLKGDKGEDAKPEDVAALLLANEEFVAMLKGKDAEAPTSEALLALIRPLIPKVEDGKTPTRKELLALMRPLIPRVKDGKTPTKMELTRLIKAVLKERGLSIKDVLAVINLPNTIDPEAVKGLNTSLERVWQAIRQSRQKGGGASGGGMGTWIHQSFSLTAATTAVTLNTKVAANGMAHIVRYQGQVLAYGTQYTILGKVVTLLFTPEDNTTLDVTYVRT